MPLIPLNANLTGGSSEANASSTVGDTGGTAGGGYRGTFINNFAARESKIDSAQDAGEQSSGGLGGSGSTGLLLGSLALGGIALFLTLKRR